MSWFLTATSLLLLLLDAHTSTGASASSVVGQLQKPARSSRLEHYLSRASSVQAAADAAAVAPLRFGDVRELSRALEQYDQQRHRQHIPRWTNDDDGAVRVLEALASADRPAAIGDGLFGPARTGARAPGSRHQFDYGLLPDEAISDESVAPRQGRSTSRYADRMDEVARTLSGSTLYAPEDDEDESDDYEEDDEDGEDEDSSRSFVTSQQQQPQQGERRSLCSLCSTHLSMSPLWSDGTIACPRHRRPSERVTILLHWPTEP